MLGNDKRLESRFGRVWDSLYVGRKRLGSLPDAM